MSRYNDWNCEADEIMEEVRSHGKAASIWPGKNHIHIKNEEGDECLLPRTTRRYNKAESGAIRRKLIAMALIAGSVGVLYLTTLVG